MEDVAPLNKICGYLPQLTNSIFRNPKIGGVIKQAMGIHPQRKLPEFPEEDFPSWAKRHNLHCKPQAGSDHNAAYFAGCKAYTSPPLDNVQYVVYDMYQYNN